MSDADPPSVQFEGITPILRVDNLRISLDYYVDMLGFQIDWHEPMIMASVSRQGSSIMLCEGDQGQPRTWIWVGVSDCEILFDEYRMRGATIRLPPTNYPWAYEMHIEDPDGHVLRMGSESRHDRTISEWITWYRG